MKSKGYDISALQEYSSRRPIILIKHYNGDYHIVDIDVYETYLMLCKRARLYSEYVIFIS